MSVYKVIKSGGDVHVQKAPSGAGPFATVDPAAALAVHTYGTGALGYGADNDPSRQTALVVLLDALADGTRALSLTPQYTSGVVQHWTLGSFTSTTSIDRWAQGAAPIGYTGVVVTVGEPSFSWTSGGSGVGFVLPNVPDLCYAMYVGGSAPGDGSITVFIEQSNDGETWAPIEGAEVVTTSAGSQFRVISFTATMAQIRASWTMSGDSPSFVFSVLLGQFQNYAGSNPFSVLP